MKKTTIDRIYDNACLNRDTVIGAYTYRVRPDGAIIRSRTEDIGTMWIDHDGNQQDSWQEYTPITTLGA